MMTALALAMPADPEVPPPEPAQDLPLALPVDADPADLPPTEPAPGLPAAPQAPAAPAPPAPVGPPPLILRNGRGLSYRLEGGQQVRTVPVAAQTPPEVTVVRGRIHVDVDRAALSDAPIQVDDRQVYTLAPGSFGWSSDVKFTASGLPVSFQDASPYVERHPESRVSLARSRTMGAVGITGAVLAGAGGAALVGTGMGCMFIEVFTFTLADCPPEMGIAALIALPIAITGGVMAGVGLGEQAKHRRIAFQVYAEPTAAWDGARVKVGGAF